MAYFVTPQQDDPEASGFEDPRYEAALQRKTEDEQFGLWNRRLEARQQGIFTYNKFMSENGKQLGARPGINSGNGRHEGRLDLSVFIALSSETGPYAGDPDWWKDDRKFYDFLAKHKGNSSIPGQHQS